MKSFFRITLSTVFFLFIPLGLYSQSVGLRSNALYWATTTPNLGFDIRLGTRSSFSLSGGYNPFSFPRRTLSDGSVVNSKFKHWVVIPEYKYWFCQSFERHYIGIHGLLGSYNIGGILSGKLSRYRYKGHAYGVGLSWGYQWALGKRWGLEASLSGGYVYLPYDKYECESCGDHLGSFKRHYFGPTKAEISFVYYLH